MLVSVHTSRVQESDSGRQAFNIDLLLGFVTVDARVGPVEKRFDCFGQMQ